MKRFLYSITSCLIMSQLQMARAQTQPATAAPSQESVIQKCAASASLTIPASQNWPELASATSAQKSSYFQCLHQNNFVPPHFAHHFFHEVKDCVYYSSAGAIKLPKGALKNESSLPAATQAVVEQCKTLVQNKRSAPTSQVSQPTPVQNQ
jgi:hypothetical protein